MDNFGESNRIINRLLVQGKPTAKNTFKMKKVVINGLAVLCTPEEHRTLDAVSMAFIGSWLEDLEDGSDIEETDTFADLNTPYVGDTDELEKSVFGDDGDMTNEEADRRSLEAFGVHFNVLIFLDGCDTHFRTEEF